jgi:hypothetical protein
MALQGTGSTRHGKAAVEYFVTFMEEERRIVATFTSGNAIGVVDEPVLHKGVPKSQRGKLWMVKIGVIDKSLADSLPFPREDFERVIRQLHEFVLKESPPQEERHSSQSRGPSISTKQRKKRLRSRRTTR